MRSATTERERWKEVTAAEPCPICAKPDWCRRSPDGTKIACRREARGAVETKRYKDGSEAFLHILRDAGPVSGNGRPKRQRQPSGLTPTASDAPFVQHSPAPAGDGQDAMAKRDAAYRRLLALLSLSPDHRENLRQRGLSDADIDAGGYRTLPTNGRQTVVKELVAALGQDFSMVPGMVMTDGRPRIAAPSGLLVPARDLAGRVVALKLRADKPADGRNKYCYLSSAKYGGPSPGSPAHVPIGVCGPVEVARITEGELKADVATRLSGVLTLSFPGVSSWRAVLPVLQDLQARTIRVAFDADAAEKPNVARPLRECVKELQAHGYTVELERWPADAGKGIDDVYAAGRAADIEILAGPAALAAAEEIAAAAGVDDHDGDLPPSDKPNEAIDDPHRLARLYIERHGSRDEQQTLWNWRDDWHQWDGAAYRVIAGPEIRAGIIQLTKAEFDTENTEAIRRYLAEGQRGQNDGGNDNGPPLCRKVTMGLVTNVAQALVSECCLAGYTEQPIWLGGDGPFEATEVLATASGLLHLPSLVAGEPCLLPPTPAFFSGNALPYGFDPAADCPEWLQFLEMLWPDDRPSINTLGEWFGYCLLPDTRQHKLLMLIGPPRSGKGTIARVLRGIVGQQNLASPTLNSLAGPFGLWPLLGKLVALVADARLSGRTDAIAVVERLLSISGEDPQDVARKNMPTLAGIRLPVRFVVMTNELPNMRDASGALTTRVILLRLTRSFRGREDKTLTDRLLRELPGILNWSIRGWQRLQERGAFVQPESGQELLDDLAEMASPVNAFVRELCYVGPEWESSVETLYAAWLEWCRSHGRDHAGTVETFGRDLRAAVPAIRLTRPRIDGDRPRWYRGIQLR